MEKYKKYVFNELSKIKVVLNHQEINDIEIADFGLGNFEEFGLGIVTYVNNDSYCAKELVMLPNQICPEHLHPRFGNYPGKKETFRVRKGIVELYVDETPFTEDSPINGLYNASKRVVLNPGDQYTIPSNTRHWFKAGIKGAIINVKI